MTLRVVLHCAECGLESLVMILGGWDIKKVTHDCKSKKFNVEYDPPRSVY